MKKRNIIAVLLALMAAVTVFAACGKDEKDGDKPVVTVVGEDGSVYEEVTEVVSELVTEIVTKVNTEEVTDKKGEKVTNKKGEVETKTEVVTEVRSEVVTEVVTKYVPYETTAPSKDNGKTDSTTVGTTTADDTIAAEEELFPDGTVIEVATKADGAPQKPKLDSVMAASKANEQFYLNCTIVTNEIVGIETGVPYKIWVKGEKFAFEVSYAALKMKAVMADGKFTMLFPAAKAYFTSDEGDGSDFIGGMDMWESIGATGMNYVKTTQVKLKGATYTCEEYTDDTNVNKYYFNSKDQLKRIECIDSEGSVTILKVTECKASVADSVFTIPSGYTKLTEDSLESILGGMM